uniref:Uncharacterized protein n=1 Tax=Plectus sambesii TaxID=2011161 RepID=A0A914WHT6_9BILA
MDQFYGGWWNDQNTKTVCIPASPGIVTAQSAQPSNCKGTNVKNLHHEEKTAEGTVQRAFEMLNLGGLLISGYNLSEYAAKSRMMKLFKKFGIEDVGIDAIFIHPQMGVTVMLIKADRKSKEFSSAYERAIEQLQLYHKQLPEVFKWLCGTEECNIPIYLAICFPFTCLNGEKRNSFINIDKSLLENVEEMREVFASRMNFRPDNPLYVLDLKKIAVGMSAYRTVEFSSLGMNALAVHELAEPLSSSSSAVNISGGDLYWTNDQLALQECSDRQRIIFGPPSTGKTTTLIQMAVRAAQSEKVGGTVYLLTDSPELRCKFNNYFEIMKETFLRPCIVGDIALLYFENGEPEDDVFVDELPSWLGLMEKFLKLRGNLAMVVSELAKSLDSENTQTFIKKQESLHVRFIEMSTVIH